MREIKFRAWDSAKKIMRSVANIYTHSHSVFVLVREAAGGPPELIRTECLILRSSATSTRIRSW